MTDDNAVSKTDFNAHRQEMREYMATQTDLMKQMVELQTKHNNLEFRVVRNERDIGDVHKRLRPLEANQSGAAVSTKYNRNLIWVLLLFVVGIASWKLKGG